MTRLVLSGQACPWKLQLYHPSQLLQSLSSPAIVRRMLSHGYQCRQLMHALEDRNALVTVLSDAVVPIVLVDPLSKSPTSDLQAFGSQVPDPQSFRCSASDVSMHDPALANPKISPTITFFCHLPGLKRLRDSSQYLPLS